MYAICNQDHIILNISLIIIPSIFCRKKNFLLIDGGGENIHPCLHLGLRPGVAHHHPPPLGRRLGCLSLGHRHSLLYLII